MGLQRKTTRSFKDAYQKDFGVALSDNEAQEVAETLTGLFSKLAKYYAEDKKAGKLPNYDQSDRNKHNSGEAE
jgi:predicted RecA/RadA family phage recombinase